MREWHTGWFESSPRNLAPEQFAQGPDRDRATCRASGKSRKHRAIHALDGGIDKRYSESVPSLRRKARFITARKKSRLQAVAE